MTWTIYHSFGLFAIMIAILSIIVTFRILFQRRKAAPAPAQAQAYPAHNRLQQFLNRLNPRHPHPASDNADATHGNSVVGLEERNHWDATILAQNEEAAIRGLREDYRYQNRSLNASVHERDLVYEDGTVIVPPPPAYTSVAPMAGPAAALSPLSAPAPRSITSSISTTTTTTTTVLPPVEHISGGLQLMLGPQTSTMPSQHFTTGSGNRYDLSSFATGTPELQLPINDAAEVAQRLDQLKGVFKPLVAYGKLATRAEARQRRGDAAAVGVGSVRHATLDPVPNPRYYSVDPPRNLEERIRGANANTLPGITIIGELRAQQNDAPAPISAPPRIRTPGIPRPMVFGHRPVLRGPMPSQAAIFADDDEVEIKDENQPIRPRTRRVRTPGTPRPMVFGTRPVFCGRMPSQAVTVESDNEDDDSDATIRGGALQDFAMDWKDEDNRGLRGGSLQCADFELEDDHKDEILVIVYEIAEPSGHHTDAHEISSVSCGEDARVSDDAKSELSSSVSNDGLVGRGSGYANDLGAGWAWAPSPFTETSTNEKVDRTWVGTQMFERRNSISDGSAREYQTLNDYVANDAEKMSSACSIYSTDANVERDWTEAVAVAAEEEFFVRWGHNKAIKLEPRKTVWQIARSKVGNIDRKVRTARKLMKMRMGKEMAEIFDSDDALAVEAREEYRALLEQKEGMVCCLGPPPISKPGQTGMDRTERVRGGWLPITAEYDIESPAKVTWEEDLSGAFKHNPYLDTRHWQCQSYTSACVACRAKPATQSLDNHPELTLEDLDRLPRRHMWRFELYRAFQAVKEALIHTAVEEFLDASKTEQNALLDDTEAEQKTFTSEVRTIVHDGYRSGVGDDEDENDGNDGTPVSAPVKATLRAFKRIEEAMITTAQLDFKAMLCRPVYPVPGDVWEKFGFGKMRKMGSLERVMMACEMLDRESFERMGEAMMTTAVLDERARKLAEMARRLGKGLRGGALHGFDDTDMKEFGDEEVVVEHQEYAECMLPDSIGRHATQDSSSGHESGSELSRVSWENSSETSQDTSAISSELNEKPPLSDNDKRKLAADAWCLFTTGGFRANTLMDETETRNRLHGIISNFRKANNEVPDGTDLPTPTICTCLLHKSLHRSMWAALQRLWNTGEIRAESVWGKGEVEELRVKSRDWGCEDLGITPELRKESGFPTGSSHQGFLRPNQGINDVWKMASIPTCVHGKTKRKLEGIEVCEHGLKVPRVRYWDRDTSLPRAFMAFATEVWADDIRRTIEEAAELERMVVLHQILNLQQPAGEGAMGWPMVGSDVPRIVSCAGPKRYLLLKNQDLKPKRPVPKGKTAKYPQALREWLVFIEGNDGDAMSVLSDDEDYIEVPNTVIDATITVGWYKDGGVEVETQGVPYVNAARPGLCPRVARRKVKAIRWPQGLRSWQRYADEEVASLRSGDYAMVMQASIILPGVSYEVGMKATSKISSATKGSPRKTSLRKEVIGFPSGAHPRLSWLGNWGFLIPAWQPRFRRSGKERLRRLSEAHRVIKAKLWDEFPHRSQNAIAQLSRPFGTDTSLRGHGITPSPLSFRTSTSLRDDGVTQMPLEEDLPYPEYPWKPFNLSSETSLRGGASGFLGLEMDLPYPELPWEPSNLATATSSTSLRGGGNALSEVLEAAQDVAYALARPRELYELAMLPEGFDPFAGDRIRGPKEIRAIQKHNRSTRARGSALRKSRYLRRNSCRWPTPTHHDPDFVYKWKDVAWNRRNTIVVPFDRRNRYSRGVSRAGMWGGKYFWDGTKMRYAQGNCRKPSQKVVRRSGWTRGARRRGGIFGEELVGSLSGLRGVEFAKNRICGGDEVLSSGVSGSLRGGQLANEDEKDQMEGLECHGARSMVDRESETKALESHNDACEYQIQFSGQDAVTTSPSNETTKLTSNAFSHLPTPSPLSFLNQAFATSSSPSVESLYKASPSHPKRTGLGKTMTWLALNNHHKKCRPGMCANFCRAIVTLPSKPPQINPVSRLESINAIAYWFGEEAEALCKPSNGALRGGFLKDGKEEGKEDGEEIDWRSPNSLRDGVPDPMAHLLMRRQCFPYRRVEVPTEEIHADLGGHNYDCLPGRCSLFCRASLALPATDVKTETHENLDAMLSYVKSVPRKQTGPSDQSSDSEVHPYSQRIAEMNRILGLTVRTDFRDGYCVEGHTHPEGMGVYTESDESRKSFRRLKGKRPERPAQRSIPPLLSPLPIRQKSHWWADEFSSQVEKGELSPPSTPENESLRGGDLDEAFKMPRSGVNGWLFERSTNWTFRRAGATSTGNLDESKGTDTNLHPGCKKLQLPDSPPPPPVIGHEAEKLAMAFEKMSFVSEELSPPSSRNDLVSYEGPVSLGYALNGKLDPYLCWPDWAYKLYDPPHSPYDSPTCDTTGRWRRPVSRHLLAGILETLPQTTGMFRRLEDGTIVRLGLQEMTAEERETMLEYAKGKKNSWGLFPCLEARLLVEEADELKELKEGLRGGVLEYSLSGPLAVRLDGDVRWSFSCCGCRPMTPDSPVLDAVPCETTTVYQSDTDSRQSEDATILSPTQSPFVDEHRSKWYSRPVDATKLKDRLRGLLQSKPTSKRLKDKKGGMVSIEMPTERAGDLQARPLKPSEVLMSKVDSHKTRALKSKCTGVWVLRWGGLRGGGLDEDEETEVGHPSPPTSDDENEDEEYVSVSLSSPPDSNSEDEWEETWEYPKGNVLDEQEMDYDLSVDLLPLDNAYADLRERLRAEHQEAMEMVDQSRLDFQEEGLQPRGRAKLRPAGHETGASVEDDNESEPDEDLDYDPDVENVAPIVYDVDTRKLSSRITSIYDADMEDFSPLPSSCQDLHEPSTYETNHSSPTYSPDVSTSASSISSADFPSKGMWVMVHPRVTQLLVAGTYRYKSKHLEKKSGLLRLHDEWAQDTPSSMRLMTSVSAFRGELRREKAWERGERDRLNSIEKLQGTLADLGRSIVEAEDEEYQDVLVKDAMEVLVVEVASDSDDNTHAISLA